MRIKRATVQLGMNLDGSVSTEGSEDCHVDNVAFIVSRRLMKDLCR